MEQDSNSSQTNDYSDKVETALYAVIKFWGKYLRTSRDFLFTRNMLSETVAGANPNPNPNHVLPTTYLCVSVAVYLYCDGIFLESFLPYLPRPGWFSIFVTTLQSLEPGKALLVVLPLIMAVALFAHALRLAAQILNVPVNFFDMYRICAYTTGTLGVLGLTVITAYYPLILIDQWSNHRWALWYALLVSALGSLGLLWLLYIYLLATKTAQSTNWRNSILCNLLAVALFIILVIPFLPIGDLLLRTVIPSEEKRDFDKSLTNAKSLLEQEGSKRYETEAFNYIFTQHPDMVKRCSRDNPYDNDADLILFVSSNGDVTDIKTWPNTNLARCLRNELLVEQIPPPPLNEFMLYLEVHLEHTKAVIEQKNQTAQSLPLHGLNFMIGVSPSTKTKAEEVARRITELGGKTEFIEEAR